MADVDQLKPQGVPGFIQAVRTKLYDNLAASIATAILGVGTAAALFVWTPLWNSLDDTIAERRNINSEEAVRIARSTVGAGTAFAVPFRNREDANQYIAVGYEDDRSGPCEEESGPKPDWCAFQLGPVEVDLLVGGQGTYERLKTRVTTGTSAGYLREPIVRYFAVVDRDGDGKREILSIADSAGTSPTLPTYVSLFEPSTGQLRQLRSFPSRFSVRNEFHNVGSGTIRSWLIDRLTEFRASTGDLCSRDLSGKLSCSESAEFKRHREEEEKSSEPYAAEFDWLDKAVGAWVAGNGVDFTKGPIKMTWDEGRHDAGQQCVGRTGKFEWRNMFKGPLVVSDLTSDRKAIAYLQDGDHHREIPTIVFGKRYVWLALVADRQLLAIDPKSFELKRFEVPEFSKGVPEGWAEEGKPPAMVSDQMLKETKDYQLEGLSVQGKWLVYAGMKLTLDVPADEFVGAKECEKGT